MYLTAGVETDGHKNGEKVQLLNYTQLLYLRISPSGFQFGHTEIWHHKTYAAINVFPQREGGGGGDTLGIRQPKQSLPPEI